MPKSTVAANDHKYLREKAIHWTFGIFMSIAFYQQQFLFVLLFFLSPIYVLVLRPSNSSIDTSNQLVDFTYKLSILLAFVSCFSSFCLLTFFTGLLVCLLYLIFSVLIWAFCYLHAYGLQWFREMVIEG